MRKTKLMVSAAALSMMAALALTGCGGGTSESAAADGGSAEGGNTITVWAWDVALKQLQSAAEKYKETNPDVEFVFEEMGTDQIYTKLATTLSTGKGLADVILLEGEQVSGYASKYPEGFADPVFQITDRRYRTGLIRPFRMFIISHNHHIIRHNSLFLQVIVRIVWLRHIIVYREHQPVLTAPHRQFPDKLDIVFSACR